MLTPVATIVVAAPSAEAVSRSSRILVAAIAGPPTPYTVDVEAARDAATRDRGRVIAHSCIGDGRQLRRSRRPASRSGRGVRRRTASFLPVCDRQLRPGARPASAMLLNHDAAALTADRARAATARRPVITRAPWREMT